MAIDLKYGKIDIPGVDEDEPVFILRAQDQLAKQTITYYWSTAEKDKCSSGLVNGAIEAEKFLANWQNEHPDRVKLPD